MAGRGWEQESKDGVSQMAITNHPVQGSGGFEVDFDLS